MAYVSGTVNNLADLRTAIIAACTANGWTLSGNVLHKGTSFITLTVSGSFLDLLGGTGESGGALTGAAPSAARIGSLATGTGLFLPIAQLVFPVAYEVFIHASPDEVAVVVSYDANKYQWLSWGKSSVTLPGTGLWFSGTLEGLRTAAGANSGISIIAAASGGSTGSRGVVSGNAFGICPALFHASQVGGGSTSATIGEYINTGLSGATGWESQQGFTYRVISAARYRAPLDLATPSAWSSEAVLLPIQVFSPEYGSAKVALVADMGHIRAIKINNIEPGDIITLGADRWKIFPWYLKDLANPNGGGSLSSTGCMGWAIRYDGP